jgi:hypothetical protein
MGFAKDDSHLVGHLPVKAGEASARLEHSKHLAAQHLVVERAGRRLAHINATERFALQARRVIVRQVRRDPMRNLRLQERKK